MSAINNNNSNKITTLAAPKPVLSKKTTTKVEEHTNLQMLKVLTAQLESKLRKNELPGKQIKSLLPQLEGLLSEESDKEMIGKLKGVISLMKQKLG